LYIQLVLAYLQEVTNEITINTGLDRMIVECILLLTYAIGAYHH